jgi:hypothetical protein
MNRAATDCAGWWTGINPKVTGTVFYRVLGGNEMGMNARPTKFVI